MSDNQRLQAERFFNETTKRIRDLEDSKQELERQISEAKNRAGEFEEMVERGYVAFQFEIRGWPHVAMPWAEREEIRRRITELGFGDQWYCWVTGDIYKLLSQNAQRRLPAELRRYRLASNNWVPPANGNSCLFYNYAKGEWDGTYINPSRLQDSNVLIVIQIGAGYGGPCDTRGW